MDSLGIKYYQTFYPNSQTIYPESISDKRKLLIKGKISRVDQIINYFKINHIVNAIIDHRQILLSKKDSSILSQSMICKWGKEPFVVIENIMDKDSKIFLTETNVMMNF